MMQLNSWVSALSYLLPFSSTGVQVRYSIFLTQFVNDMSYFSLHPPLFATKGFLFVLQKELANQMQRI